MNGLELWVIFNMVLERCPFIAGTEILGVRIGFQQ